MAAPEEYEFVDLSSDSDDENDYFLAEDLQPFDPLSSPPAINEGDHDIDHMLEELNARYSPAFGAAESIIDLTNIPDIDVPPSSPLDMDDEHAFSNSTLEGTQLVTEAVCLQMILDVLPDVCVDHVLTVIREKTNDSTRTAVQSERIITELLDGEAYPKEADEAKNKKRKREEDDDWSSYERANRDPAEPTYETDALDLLKDEFLEVPVRHITNVLKDQKTLFKAYVVLEEQVRKYGRIATRYSRIGKSRIKRGAELILIERGSQIPKEVHAAKKKVQGEMAKRRKAEEMEQAEEANLKRAQEMNEMGDCACCFNDVPLNRMINCNGHTTHLYCLECPKRQIESLMGQSRCRIKCFGVSDCDGTFTRKQVQQILCERTFERLEHMQQQEDLAAAGLDFLSECPFCDFKMECLPVEIDKEFRCQNKKCSKTSCRLCQKETHIPLSCEEAKKDGQLTLRHIVEEAMSAALIRQCNSCKHPFVKEYGCNKMSCSKCGNVQCYVCSKNVTNYDHFGDTGRGRCPLHDNVEDRHEKEVKTAAEEAMAKVRADNPGLSDADLMIKVSDRVKQAEDARKGRVQGHGQAQAFPYHVVNDGFQHRFPAGPLRAAPLQNAVPHPVPQPPVFHPVAQYVPVQQPPMVPVPYYIQPVPFIPHAQPVQVGQPIQPIQPVQRMQYYQPLPRQEYQGPAQQRPPQQNPGGFQASIDLPPFGRFLDGNRQAAPVPPPPPPPLQAAQLPAEPDNGRMAADLLQQRVNQLQQLEQHNAHIQLARRARILQLQRDNLNQQRVLLQQQIAPPMDPQLADLDQPWRDVVHRVPQQERGPPR